MTNLKFFILFIAFAIFSNVSNAQCGFIVNNGGFDYGLNVNLTVDSAIYTQSGSTCNVQMVVGYDVNIDTLGGSNPTWWDAKMFTLQGNFNCNGGSGSSFFNLPNEGGQGSVTSATFSYSNTVCSAVILDCPITLQVSGPQLNSNGPCGSLAINSPLPLDLVEFHIVSDGQNEIEVNWQTLSELNMSHFVLEQSNDLNSWKEIDWQQATNLDMLSNYYFDMPRPNQDQYLRLKMEDLDGKVQYSKIIKVAKVVATDIVISPNPAGEKIILKGTVANQLNIVNAVGQLFKVPTLSATSLDVSGLPSGLYFIVQKHNSALKAASFIKK